MSREEPIMIRKMSPWVLLLAGVLTGLLVSSSFVLLAQDRAGTTQPTPSRVAGERPIDESRGPVNPSALEERRPARPVSGSSSGSPTVQDVLLRPYRFAFSRPTSLAQVCAHLKQTLNVPVVLDRAALARQDVEPEVTVQLELDGIRLKTGLKLLLDQVGLTYHAVTEDNLLIITDREGSEDPLDRVWAELRALHRDLHDVQDAVDDLNKLIGGDQAEGLRVRKPTIIEEMPEDDRDQPKPGGVQEKPTDPARKPEGARVPAPVPRPAPSRVPLVSPRRRL
jgi:hypothetical protein